MLKNFTIRQLTYGVNADFLDEYLQMSERSSCTALDHFCQSDMKFFGPGYLRKPSVTDVEKLYRHHEEKYGFLGMLERLDCTNWEWFGCPYGFKGKYVRRDHGLNPFILLEAVASGQAPEIPFVANGITYLWGYYLVDRIYPELATLVKTIPEQTDDDHKRILYKLKHESATLILDDSCMVARDLDNFVMGEVRQFSSINNLRVLLHNEGFMDIEIVYLDGNEDLFAQKHLCIKTKHANNILDSFKIIVKGKVFQIRAKELFVWSSSFKEVPEVVHCSDDESVKNEADINVVDNTVNNEEEERDSEAVSDTYFGDNGDAQEHDNEVDQTLNDKE
nr:hypothetical protein [Tanacetum cinerariifolium]